MQAKRKHQIKLTNDIIMQIALEWKRMGCNNITKLPAKVCSELCYTTLYRWLETGKRLYGKSGKTDHQKLCKKLLAVMKRVEKEFKREQSQKLHNVHSIDNLTYYNTSLKRDGFGSTQWLKKERERRKLNQ